MLLFNRVWLFVTSGTAACQASLSFTISRSLLKLMSIESIMSSNHLILCRPLVLLPSIFPRSGSFPMSRFFTSGSQVEIIAKIIFLSLQTTGNKTLDFYWEWSSLLLCCQFYLWLGYLTDHFELGRFLLNLFSHLDHIFVPSKCSQLCDLF